MDATANYIKALQALCAHEGVNPESKFVDTTGPVKRVHYLQAGSGKPLILIHGGGGSTDQWINMIKHLQQNFTLYIVDRPGHGLTDAFNYRGVNFREHCTAFIKSFMDALQLETADFVANSMGGYWTALFAMQYPKRVHRIAFLGAPAGFSRSLPFFLRLLGVRGLNDLLWATMAKPSVKGTHALYKMLLVAREDGLTPAYIESGYQSSVLPNYKMAWLTLLENIATMKGFRASYYIGDEIANIPHKSLFLWGDRDAFQTPEEGKALTDKMPASTFKIAQNAGHLPWLDDPAFCAEEIKSFMQ